jgi:siroheme synthase-like protein
VYLPLYFPTRSMSCLIVGGGSVAARKVDILLASGCTVTVIAPQAEAALRKATELGRITWHRRAFAGGDCRGFQLVIAATRDPAVNRAVASESRKLGIPVNVVDAPDLCTVIFGASWREGPLTVSACSGGVAPFLAAAVRDRIAACLHGVGAWTEAAAGFRAAVRNGISDPEERGRLYMKFVERMRAAGPVGAPQRRSLQDWLTWLHKPDDG